MEDKSQYAGFWKRVGAYLIDYVIVLVGIFVGSFMAGLCVGIVMGIMHAPKESIQMVAGVVGIVMALAVMLFYWCIFECSSKQATIGKMALGIVVTDMNGGRITFWRSFGRQFGRIISGFFFCLGYIICGFTDRRQCAHDLLAGTLVVKKDAPIRIAGGDSFQIMTPV